MVKSLLHVAPSCKLGVLDQELTEFVTDIQMSLIPYHREELDTRIDADWSRRLFNIKI